MTYGTGSFVLANAGPERGAPPDGILQTVAWRLGDDAPVYALEGSVFVAGAALQWLRDGLGVLEDARESEAIAARSTGTTACTSCRRSRGSALRTGRRRRVAL